MKMDADDAVPETGRKDLGGLDTVQEDVSFSVAGNLH